MIRSALLLAVLAAITVSEFVMSVDEDAMNRCHRGQRDGRPRCGEYANLPKRHERERLERITRIIKRQSGSMPCDEDKMPSDKYTICVKCQNGEMEGDACAMPKCKEGDTTCMDCLKNGGKPDECGAEMSGGGPETTGNGDLTGIVFPTLDNSTCLSISWGTGREFTAANNFGNCMKMTTNATHRFISSNNVPDFYMNPYCPIGIGKGYCIQAEIDAGKCFFSGLTCGDTDNGPGTNDYGDVWVPQEDNYAIKLEGNPTLPDRPSDMYDASKVGAAKTNGPTVGVAVNGIGIQGPNDAGDVSIDGAGFQLNCGGHVTPPMGNEETTGETPSGPPKYHFHKAAECLEAFTNASKGLADGAKPNVHAGLVGWATDGFGIYAYQDINGDKPVVDECGGHFGPTDTGEVKYHYHSRVIVPYTLACQGPSLGKCADTQRGTNYCHTGCGYDVCVQPGTKQSDLEEYLAKFDEEWLSKYSVNPYNSASTPTATLLALLTSALLLVLH